MTDFEVPYFDLAASHLPLREELIAAVSRVLDHGHFILGPEVEELEGKLASLVGVHGVVGVGNGTDALRFALRQLGIGQGDDVLTVSHSFAATASAIVLEGARPVFVDVDDHTMLMDTGDLERARTPATRAVMVVHLNGQPCELGAVLDFCRQHDLALVEDCAQAIGTHDRGRHVGSTGIGCFSLHPLKVLGGYGDGGFVCARDEEELEALRRMRNLGLVARGSCGEVSENSRLDCLHAAMLLPQFARLEASLARRRELARAYREALAGLVRLQPDDGPGDVTTYCAFVVRHPARDELVEGLARRGVSAKVHYPFGIHQQPAFRDLHTRPLPVTEKVVDEILSLPIGLHVDDRRRDKVIAAVRAAVEEIA